jgi:DNA-nicking Smr family endonuclease
MTDDDDDLFRKAVADARPLRPPERASQEKRKPRPKARFSRADEASALQESMAAGVDELHTHSGDSLRFHRPHVGKRTMRKLARGGYSVQAEIDLHGMTVAEAQPRLQDFIENSARSGRLCVRVVHGKGLGSGHRGPILKQKVNRWLRRWDPVLAFVSTRQVDGGTGAVYVLLQRTD